MKFGELSTGDYFILRWQADEEKAFLFRKIKPVKDEKQNMVRNAIECSTGHLATIGADNMQVVKIKM